MAKPKGMIKCEHCNGKGWIEPKPVGVGDLICAARKKRNMTQEELAKLVKLSRTQICNIELGRSDVTVKTLVRFALALKVDVKTLIPFLGDLK